MTGRVISFAVVLMIASALTPLVRSIALRFNIVDVPNHRKLHRTPIPLLGGLAIYLGVVFALLLSVSEESWRNLIALLLGSTFLVLVGLLDDRVGLNAKLKLLGAIPFAGLILAMGGIRVTWSLGPFIPSPSANLIFSLIITILWVVTVTSAFTILDHMDGLCAGIAATASVFFFIIAVLEGLLLVGILSAAIIGATLGFLKWNFKPASIFMGDCGALFVGFMMSALAIMLTFPELKLYTSWMIPILILGVPIFDTLLVIVSRLRRGIAPARSPGKDHSAVRRQLGWDNEAPDLRET